MSALRVAGVDVEAEEKIPHRLVLSISNFVSPRS